MEQGNLTAVFAENAALGAKAQAFLREMSKGHNKQGGFFSLFEYASEQGQFIESETEEKLAFIVGKMIEDNKPYVTLGHPEDITISYLTRNGYAILQNNRLTLTDKMFDRLEQWSGVKEMQPPSFTQDRTVRLILE